MRLSPVNHPASAKRRQEYVLRRMREEGWITERQHEAELARPIAVAPAGGEPARRVVRRRRPASTSTSGTGRRRSRRRGCRSTSRWTRCSSAYAEAALEAGLRAVDKRQGFRGPLLHLEPAQVDAALPLWRARLARAEPRPGTGARVGPRARQREGDRRRGRGGEGRRPDGAGAAARGGGGVRRARRRPRTTRPRRWTSGTRPARSRSPTSRGRASGTRSRRPPRRRRSRRSSRAATWSSSA